MNHKTTKPAALTVRSKTLAAPELWQREGSEIHIGCLDCVERDLCGGLNIGAPVHNCLDLCCGAPESCKQYACPMNLSSYSEYVNGVGGLGLRPYTQSVAPVHTLPAYVPALLDVGSLRGPLSLSVAAISLYDILDARSGLASFASRDELLLRFKLRPNTKLVIFATEKDRQVENFWHTYQPKRTAESLRRLRPALITTPNFSMHADAPRHDNLVSMARIANVYEDFAAAGLPAAIHTNGRTPHDFVRWAEYLRASPQISVIAYEMGTIGRSKSRREWHAKQLVQLARSVRRPLTLALRGGSRQLTELSRAFDHVVMTDTTALMKAKKRQSGCFSHGELSWAPSPMDAGTPIDKLFIHNIRVSQRAVAASLPSRQLPQQRTTTAQLLFDGLLSP